MSYLRLPILALAALGIAAGSAVWTAETSAQSQVQAQSQSFDETQLQAFAGAVVEIRRISEAYQPKLQGAESAQEQQDLRQEQMEEMVGAVEDSGLTVEQYNAIHAAYQNDPAVAEKIHDYLAQAR